MPGADGRRLVEAADGWENSKTVQGAGVTERRRRFLAEPLPEGYGVLSFVRVLHDWPAGVARTLLEKAKQALPLGGRLVICEEFRTRDRGAGRSWISLLVKGDPIGYPEGMSLAQAYVETSIPSFYYTTRTGAASVARREWTRQWWSTARDHYALVTSDPVLDELRRGDYPSKESALTMVQELPVLEMAPAIGEIVEAYVRHRLMPEDPTGDALHLALASYHNCEFLVTWNCQHLANANKYGHIRRVNNLLGLYVPMLATPLELLGENHE